VLAENETEALNHSHCLVICTEWRPFRAPDFEELRERLLQPVIFDGRNIHDPDRMAREGFTYFGIGLGQLPQPVMAAAAIAR
jgi:UDPglucose 6-dehydrogenase